MKFILKYVLSSFLLLLFIFYSAGISAFIADKNVELDCNMKKNCSCCEMNAAKSSCCISHTKHFTLTLNLPCHHPNFEGTNFKLDPVIVLLFNEKLLITDYSEYRTFNYTFYQQTELNNILKPPRT